MSLKTTLSGGQRKVDAVLARRIRRDLESKEVMPYSGKNYGTLPPEYNAIRHAITQLNPFGSYAGLDDAIGGMLAGRAPTVDPTASNDYFQKSIAAPLLQTYDRDIRPRIREAFAGGGSFSGAMGAAQGRALENMFTQLAAQRGELSRQDQVLGSQRQAQGIGFAQQQQLQPINVLSGMEALLGPIVNQRREKNLGIYSEFLRTQPGNSPYITNALNYLSNAQVAVKQGGDSTPWGAIGTGAGILASVLFPPAAPFVGAGIAAAAAKSRTDASLNNFFGEPAAFPT